MNDFFNRIDYHMLRDQKEFLFRVISSPRFTISEKENAQGLIHLIDSLQDAAVELARLSESQVFDLEDVTR